MATRHATISEFDNSDEDWTSYTERLEPEKIRNTMDIVHMCCLLHKVFAEKTLQEEEDQIILTATQLVLN